MRDGKETATLRESATAFALEHAGPSANMLLSMADGFDAASQGDYTKAAKKWAPAGFRNFITAHELATKGAQDNRGNEVLNKDAFGTGLLIAQAVGFRSDLLANTQYVNFTTTGIERKVLNQRNQILSKLDRADRNEDADAYEKYFEEMEKFNALHPEQRITLENLKDSLSTRRKQRAQSWHGLPIDKKQTYDEFTTPSRLAADKAEEEGRKK
jgi:hypothetical protein